MSHSTVRVILGQVLGIATCGTRTHRGDSLWLVELKENTKIMVEYPHPGIRKFSNIRLVCFSSVHLFCRNTQMRLLVQPHESCHNISKQGIFFLILMIYYVTWQKSQLIMLYCVLMPHFCTYTEYLFAHDQSRMRKMQSGEQIMRISLSALMIRCQTC